jgi:hypothetical protein
MLQAMLRCRAADDMAKGNQTSSTKLGTDVDERLQKDSSNAKLIYSSFIESVRFNIATFVKYAKKPQECLNLFVVLGRCREVSQPSV